MYLTRLVLHNYRNFHTLSLSFDKPMNIFYGGNAQGKTNLLESIFFAATARSYRTTEDVNLIRWEEPYTYVKAEFIRRNQPHTVEIGLAKGEKQLKLDGKVLPRRAELIGNLVVVLFTPDDLYLVKGEPALRRRFIDLAIAQINNHYLFALQQYHRVVKQRNFAFRQVKFEKAHRDTVTVWNKQLIQYGSEIILTRKETLLKMNERTQMNYQRISGSSQTLTLYYETSFSEEEMLDFETLSRAYHQKLDELSSKEFELGVTLLGPHRDDILIFIDGHDLKSFGSQGEQRSAVIAMKLAEIEYIQNQLGESPIVALDDFISELDERRVEYISAVLLQQQCQTFITAVHPLRLAEIEAVAQYQIENGSIK
ncbi:MAG: DNA replication/repair protein RecF [bacterium]|nr:DNA replication/repair protein RecF [bacterium]